jgi:hypothetical protein
MRPSKLKKKIFRELMDSDIYHAARSLIFNRTIQEFKDFYYQRHNKHPADVLISTLVYAQRESINAATKDCIQELVDRIVTGNDGWFFTKKFSLIAIVASPLLYSSGSFFLKSFSSVYMQPSNHVQMTQWDVVTSGISCLAVLFLMIVAALYELKK